MRKTLGCVVILDSAYCVLQQCDLHHLPVPLPTSTAIDWIEIEGQKNG